MLTSTTELDTHHVDRWLRQHGAEPEGTLRAEVVEGGLSNLTYLLLDGTGVRWVLRRPPLRSLSPKAHDVVREATVLSGLAGGRVPVPGVVGLERDADVPFYVMDFVPGTVVRDSAGAAELPSSARSRAGAALAEVLAAMHAVDPARIGIGDPARGRDYLIRQIALFRRQAVQERDVPLAEAERVADELSRTAPASGRVSLVHGDYRLNNVIVDPSTGDVRAVLDWELSALGDPLADLGGLLVHWVQPADDVRPFADSPTGVEGFASREEVVAAYLRSAGLPASTDVTWYWAFASWRLAVALDGVHRRFTSGAYGAAGGGAHVEDLPRVVPELIGEAARLLGTRPRPRGPGLPR